MISLVAHQCIDGFTSMACYINVMKPENYDVFFVKSSKMKRIQPKYNSIVFDMDWRLIKFRKVIMCYDHHASTPVKPPYIIKHNAPSTVNILAEYLNVNINPILLHVINALDSGNKVGRNFVREKYKLAKISKAMQLADPKKLCDLVKLASNNLFLDPLEYGNLLIRNGLENEFQFILKRDRRTKGIIEKVLENVNSNEKVLVSIYGDDPWSFIDAAWLASSIGRKTRNLVCVWLQENKQIVLRGHGAMQVAVSLGGGGHDFAAGAVDVNLTRVKHMFKPKREITIIIKSPRWGEVYANG